MATELMPNERDVVRLRLGLDDGVPKTAKEVAAVFGGRFSDVGKSVQCASLPRYKTFFRRTVLTNQVANPTAFSDPRDRTKGFEQASLAIRTAHAATDGVSRFCGYRW